MTAAQMKDEFLIGYDKVTNFTAPGYTDEEISKFLNDSQDRYVKTHYSENNINRTGYEETEKRSKDLSELKRFTQISSFTTGNHPNSVFAELPEGFLWATKEEADITVTDCNGVTSDKRIGVKPVSDDYYSSNIVNPFKKPHESLAWRLDFSRTDNTQVLSSTNFKRHEIITDGSPLVNYYITYIKYPQAINVDSTAPSDCELDPGVHKEIVELAVSIALETTQEPRYQTQKQEEQQTLE